MKKSLVAIFGIGILLYPLICFSSYIIHLKDGREFATDRYWEEEDQIKFKRYGGVIGIQKDLVREIEEIEDVEELPAEKDKVAVQKAGEAAEKVVTEKDEVPETAKKAGEGKKEVPSGPEKAKGAALTKEQEKPEVSEEEKKKAEQEKAAKKEAFLEEKRQIIDEIKRVSSGFKEAKASNDRVKKDDHWKKRLLLREELSKLRKQVMSEYGGTLPPWWDSVR